MSRRRKSGSGKKLRHGSGKAEQTVVENPPPPVPQPPKPRKWLLWTAAALQAGWLAFLLVLACSAGP